MHLSKIGFDRISALSFKDVFYQNRTEDLREFYAFSPDENGLEASINARSEFPVDRPLLHEVLKAHYAKILPSAAQQSNIENILDEKTFTVVTAHQPSILGGPAYYLYKMCSVINLCTTLKAKHPNNNFVPVFVSGAEDHDFDEIKNIHVYGKTISWNTSQKGSVGRFALEGVEATINEVSEILGTSSPAVALGDMFKQAFQNSVSYNDFVFLWVNALFKEYGLLVLNMDDHRLKNRFVPIMEKEIREMKSESIVQKTQDALAVHGFKPQAFARDVNLFYMSDQSRERIYFENNTYKIVNSDKTFSLDEIIQELHAHPENFSPNVIMRPLYQEFTLPNIAYVGGGGEVAYWLERKKQFEFFGVFFPCIMRRNSVMLIPKSIQKTLDKLQINEDDLLKDEDNLISSYLKQVSTIELNLSEELSQIKDMFAAIASKAKSIDPTLEPFVIGEGSKIIKATEAIESRMVRAVKQKEETAVNQLKNVKAKLFPNLGLQERTDSLLPYLVTEEHLLDELIKILNPLDKAFLFIYL